MSKVFCIWEPPWFLLKNSEDVVLLEEKLLLASAPFCSRSSECDALLSLSSSSHRLFDPEDPWLVKCFKASEVLAAKSSLDRRVTAVESTFIAPLELLGAAVWVFILWGERTPDEFAVADAVVATEATTLPSPSPLPPPPPGQELDVGTPRELGCEDFWKSEWIGKTDPKSPNFACPRAEIYRKHTLRYE